MMRIEKFIAIIAFVFTSQVFAADLNTEALEITVEALEDPTNPLNVLNKTYQGSREREYYLYDIGDPLDINIKPFGKDYPMTLTVNGVTYGVVFLRLLGQTKELSLSSVMRALGAKKITGYEKGRRYWESQDEHYLNKGILVLDRLPNAETKK